MTHVAAKTEGGGLFVMDIWDSRESAEAFLGQIHPDELAKFGPMEPRFVAVHDRLVP